MSEILVPYTDFAAPELGARLHDIVTENKELLAARHMLGLIARYGADVDTAVAKVQKGQGELNPQHFAVVDEAGDVQGAASIIVDLPLGKLTLPVPPRYARHVPGLYTVYPHASHNVQAWTGARRIVLLNNAYSALADHFRTHVPAAGMRVWSNHERPWTIEPVGSPGYAHEAIASAGLHMVAVGWFDDAESTATAPPRSALYAHLQSQRDLPAAAQLKELKTGRLSLLARAAAAVEDSATQHPLGT